MLLVFFTFNVPTRVRTRNFEKISKFIKNVKICNFLIFGLRKTRKNLCFCFAAKNARKTTQKPGSFRQKCVVVNPKRAAKDLVECTKKEKRAERFDGIDVICVCRVVRPKTGSCAWCKTTRLLALQLACRVAVPKSCADDRSSFAVAEGNTERPRAGRCEARLLQARQCLLPPREALVEGGCDVGSKH